MKIFVKACLKGVFMERLKEQKVDPVFHKQKNSILEELCVLF